MKSWLLKIIVCASFVFAGAQTQLFKDSLSISKSIGIKGSVNFNDYEIKFKDVIRDSRCIKNVMC